MFTVNNFIFLSTARVIVKYRDGHWLCAMLMFHSPRDRSCISSSIASEDAGCLLLNLSCIPDNLVKGVKGERRRRRNRKKKGSQIGGTGIPPGAWQGAKFNVSLISAYAF